MIAVATVWLAVTGRLALYIHPRYDVFTTVMAGVAIALCVGAIAAAVHRARRRARVPTASLPLGHDGHAGHDDDGSAHDHGDDLGTTRIGRMLGVTAVVVSGALAVTMIALPPATLSSATAIQRDINSESSAFDLEADAAAFDAATGASADAFAAFTVREWSGILRQTADPTFYAGKPVDIVGFITPHPDDPELFFVSRFVISCCAVDAQPYGVPVLLPSWDDELVTDDWVRVTGGFVSAPASHGAAIVLDPVEVTIVDEPAQPYLF